MLFDVPQQNTLRDILTWRRDIRHFKTDPVPESMLERLREAMELAPSVGNARPWRMVRVKSPSLRQSIRDNFEHANVEAASLYEDKQKADYAKLKLSGLDKAPEQFAVFTEIDPSEGHGLGRQTMPEALRQSTAMAVHTLWLAARAENLGLGMVSILDPLGIKDILAVPDAWEFSAYLCLGWPENSDDTPLLHREKWQQNTKTNWIEK
ncbi:MAG: 5,6-dimethylbenzimidazole synthase [Hyphomicrobiales bacterium]